MRIWFFIVLFFSAQSLLSYLNVQLRRTEVARPGDEAALVDLDPALVKAATFGFWPIATDWFWIQGLVRDYSTEKVKNGEHPPMYFYLKMATRLDEAYYNAYFYGSQVLMIAKDDDKGAEEVLLSAVRFIEQSMIHYPDGFIEEYWPDYWFYYVSLGYLYFFELHDIPKAALYFAKGADVKGSPEYLKALTKRMHTTEGKFQTGIRLLTFMDQQSQDYLLKIGYRKKLRDLQINYYLFLINRDFQRFRAEALLSETSNVTDQNRLVRFLRTTKYNPIDPWGGKLSVDESGKIITETEFDWTMGIEY